MTPEQLNEIENRANQATQGPWVALGNDVAAEVKTCTCYGGQAPYGHEQFCGLDGPLITGAAPQNAEFIASARTDVPQLVAEVRRLRGQVQRVEIMLEEMGEGKSFGILTRGREDEYPISYFIAMLEQALEGESL